MTKELDQALAAVEAINEGEFAALIATVLDHSSFVDLEGWSFIGLDTGEIEVTTAEGKRWRLTVSKITEDEEG